MSKLALFLSPAIGFTFMAKVQAIPLPEDTRPLCDGSFTTAVEQSLRVPATTTDSIPSLGAPQSQPTVPQTAEELAIANTYPLSLDAAISLGLQRNESVQLARLQLQQSCFGLQESRAALYPQVSLSASFSNANSSGSFSPVAQFYPPNSGALSASQQLTLATLQQQQASAQQQLQNELSQLQSRLQQLSTQVQQETFQQRINTLQQRADTSAILPFVNTVSLSLPTQGSGATSGGGGGGGGAGSFFNGGVSVAYEIFSFGRREATINSSKKLIQSNALEVQRQLEQLRQDITSAYYDIQQAQALITVAEGSVKQAEENLRVLNLGEQAGVRTRFEVLQASVTLADVQQLLIQAASLRTIAQRQLAERLNLPNGVNVELPSPNVDRAGSWSLSLEDSIVIALNNRVELPQNDLQRDISILQRRILRSQQRPQLQGVASFDIADDLEDRVLGAYGYTVGVQMNFNFFDGGQTKAQLRQLDRTIDILEQQYEQQRETIRFAVEQAYYNLRANESNIAIAAQSVQQAAEGLRLARLRFEAGVGTTLEIVRAQADLTQAEGNQVAAILGYNRSLAILERATGYATQTATNSQNSNPANPSFPNPDPQNSNPQPPNPANPPSQNSDSQNPDFQDMPSSPTPIPASQPLQTQIPEPLTAATLDPVHSVMQVSNFGSRDELHSLFSSKHKKHINSHIGTGAKP
jgi:outer membrane factor, OMF family